MGLSKAEINGILAGVRDRDADERQRRKGFRVFDLPNMRRFAARLEASPQPGDPIDRVDLIYRTLGRLERQVPVLFQFDVPVAETARLVGVFAAAQDEAIGWEGWAPQPNRPARSAAEARRLAEEAKLVAAEMLRRPELHAEFCDEHEMRRAAARSLAADPGPCAAMFDAWNSADLVDILADIEWERINNVQTARAVRAKEEKKRASGKVFPRFISYSFTAQILEELLAVLSMRFGSMPCPMAIQEEFLFDALAIMARVGKPITREFVLDRIAVMKLDPITEEKMQALLGRFGLWQRLDREGKYKVFSHGGRELLESNVPCLSVLGFCRKYGISLEESLCLRKFGADGKSVRFVPRDVLKTVNRIGWSDEGSLIIQEMAKDGVGTLAAAARNLGMPESTARDHLEFFLTYVIEQLDTGEMVAMPVSIPGSDEYSLCRMIKEFHGAKFGLVLHRDAADYADAMGQRLSGSAATRLDGVAAAAVAAEATMRAMGVECPPLSAIPLLERDDANKNRLKSVADWVLWLNAQRGDAEANERMRTLAALHPEETVGLSTKTWAEIREADFAIRRMRLIASRSMDRGSASPMASLMTKAGNVAITHCGDCDDGTSEGMLPAMKWGTRERDGARLGVGRRKVTRMDVMLLAA